MEPERDVHKPWEELFHVSPCWKPSVKCSYDGYDSGGKVGPPNQTTETLRTQKILCSTFFFIFEFSLFTYIAKQTNKYAYEEGVTPIDAGHDRDEKNEQFTNRVRKRMLELSIALPVSAFATKLLKTMSLHGLDI